MNLLLWISIIIIVGFTFFCFFSAWLWRKQIASEFAAYVKKKRPDILFDRITGSCIDFRFDDGRAGQINLYKLIATCKATPTNNQEEMQQVYEFFFNSILANDAVEEFSLQNHSSSIRPQLVNHNQLIEFKKRGKILYRSLNSLSLNIVYVLDNEQNMQYLDSDALNQLGISLDELHKLALSNLKDTFPEQTVRAVLEKQALELIATHDCYDAARILLVPEYLKDAEKLIALIPDRDTLGLAPIPVNNDMSGLNKLAGTPFNQDRLLINRPVLVTKNSFELM